MILIRGTQYYAKSLGISLFVFRPSKKKPHVSRPDFYKKESGRVGFFVSYYFLLHAFLHIITFPQGYVRSLRSNINKTKHQILIKHKFV